MLPFGRRKGESGAGGLEGDLGRDLGRDLGPDDAARPRKRTLTGRKILDEALEVQVAGECLASIAQGRESDADATSRVRAVLSREAAGALSTRAPRSAGPPPLPARARAAPGGPTGHAGALAPSTPSVPSAPAAAFVRRSSPFLTSAFAPPREAPPVALAPAAPERTIIVVRERPRAAWFVAAALLGAAGALGGVRLVMSHAAPVPPAVTAPAPSTGVAPAASAAAIVTPPSPALAPQASLAGAPLPAPAADGGPASGAAVIRFGDDDGVAITVPASPPAAPPEPPRRRALTPEQQLAEAQLKASMK
ncbi:MAG: hypothetical protein JWP97_4707 [Labilithrix sp.]|nr:hypothetical protein [Labilithrix sp.]